MISARGQTRAAGVWSAARVVAFSIAALGFEYARVAAMRAAEVPAGIAGGLLLCGLAIVFWRRPAALGLGPGRWAGRLLGAGALTVVLLLPAAVRWPGHPPLWGWEAVMATVIAVGEELAFRGAVYTGLEELSGSGPAVVGSAALWTAAHALSHPPAFLFAVFGAGLVLGLWRWAARDLWAPIGAHVLSDLLL